MPSLSKVTTCHILLRGPGQSQSFLLMTVERNLGENVNYAKFPTEGQFILNLVEHVFSDTLRQAQLSYAILKS